MTIGGLDFVIRASELRRTVGITVDRDGTLLLHTPTDADPDRLARWVRSHRSWVHQRLAEKDVLLSPRPAKQFVNGEGFDYLGRHYRLLLTDDPAVDDGGVLPRAGRPAAGRRRTLASPVRLTQGRIHLPRSLAATDADGSATLIGWYRHRGATWLPPRIRPWASRMGVDITGLDVRDLGHRWGSLSTTGRINIHWATMQLPVSLVDYVLVHELAHAHERNHTPIFWRLVERALPDYETRKNRLAALGATLWLG
ncbi:putative metal-dependent hydrolase [Frankia casuarinae]|uniref:YgjP-like metallopeptidase domain-containing protein n=1 Tax=Frankia casuarinae (strain DSM 45818 / CECT 9043 / HFP020203 / CcI3) TaxID=106370 RepID=Q2J5T2_FRACC|nr:SprT family zinc-dependent metalloprotease [Frankia casuarinae]ABD13360.1 protein of unknown function DUF45 [Frankia casuarinae]EYT89768.1 putative metal-dependent hydrolase [Frankia casuarinae]